MADVPQRNGEQVADVVRAALSVPGVAAVRVEPDNDDGHALLRLELAPGVDEQLVAEAVDVHLRSGPRAGAAVGERDRPEVFSGTLPTVGSVPVAEGAGPAEPRRHPTVGSPPVAAPSSPQWLASTAVAESRLVLERVQQVTEGMTTTCTVVLVQHEDRHTGVADGAATPAGAHRSLATATARAVESAASGRLRLDVEAADVLSVAGEPTAVVVLSVLTRRGGAERLSGASLAGADAARAVVKAVLAACNRRVAVELVQR